MLQRNSADGMKIETTRVVETLVLLLLLFIVGSGVYFRTGIYHVTIVINMYQDLSA